MYYLLYQYTSHWLLLCWRIMMLLSYRFFFYLYYNEAVGIQICTLLTRSQCKVSDTQVTVKACGPLVIMGFLSFSQSTCVCWFELFSQVSDVAHGPLLNVFCSIFNIVTVLNSIINIILTWLFTWTKKLYMFICFVVVHHKSCIDMVKIIIHSLTRNNDHKTYPD